MPLILIFRVLYLYINSWIHVLNVMDTCANNVHNLTGTRYLVEITAKLGPDVCNVVVKGGRFKTMVQISTLLY